MTGNYFLLLRNFQLTLASSSLLFLTLTQSRQAWTNTIFKRYIPSAPTESASQGTGSTANAPNSTVLPASFKVVGEKVTLIIGPHIFRDTRFLASWTQEAPSQLVILFEFKETAGTFWLFPSASVVERLNFAPPFEVIASFRLPTGIFDDIQAAVVPAASAAMKNSSSSSYQGLLTMQMLNVGKELYQFIQAYTKDPLLTFGDFFAKFKGSSPGWPSYPFAVQPCRQPAGLGEAIFSTKRPKRKDLPDKPTLPYPNPSSKKSTQAAPKKKIPQPPAAPAPPKSLAMELLGPEDRDFNIAPSLNRKCAYCGAKSTPMWRRGPDGAGTLCNACGVKWKNGKISFSPSAMHQGTPSPRAAAPAKKPRVLLIEDQEEEIDIVAGVEAGVVPVQLEEQFVPMESGLLEEEEEESAPLKKRRS